MAHLMTGKIKYIKKKDKKTKKNEKSFLPSSFSLSILKHKS